ncbi:MAG: PAS domain-containing protein [Burkholderiales bacterium]|nr:PAS domain-containing protein [Burkholderiales bacterium]
MSLREYAAARFGWKASRWTAHLAAALITVTCVMLAALLWRRLGAIPDPGLILVLTVAVSTYVAGGFAGMLSAAIVLVCSFVLFSHPAYLFRYDDMNWRQVMAIVVACPLIALMVGSLKEQIDELRKRTAIQEQLGAELEQLKSLREAHHLGTERFRLTVGAVREYAIVMLDSKGMVIGWNAGAERLSGYSEGEIVGQNYSRFFIREDILKKPERLLDKAMFTGQVEAEGWAVRSGGERAGALRDHADQEYHRRAHAGFLMVTVT